MNPVGPVGPIISTRRHGRVWSAWNNYHGASITWEELVESMSRVVASHHVEKVCYCLFSAEEYYNHGFAWSNIEAINGIGPVTMKKIRGVYQTFLDMKP